ncbi:3-oxoacyl-[acyl-carrier protein] reductase [Planomicrobium soli]|uniref:3-oxoacyl-[acyl-carrier protein] reductase n=1 Tax=Planomicrobium soli TaxID=1176648 RepID=A0A2P8H415_9BACL|nr:SDR family oxidoreductase [Planomicrobium soli]PSL40966.1 3-oxoacyl-[acyl-carrier protein] reductase [Planomicrobium soli]
MDKLAGKVAVVTGASRLQGIGAAICKELAANGCRVFFTYWKSYDKTMPWGIDEDEPSILEEELKRLGVDAYGYEMDLSQIDAPEKLINKVVELMGQPDILVNNATYSVNGGFSQLTAKELDNHYFVNIRATAMLSAKFATSFNKKNGGRIINMTSGQFQGAMPGELAYATTKGAVDALTLTLSAELAPLGITVNAVNPGPTDTGWMGEGIKEEIIRKFPFERIGEPKDAAKLIGFLASEDAEWITGQIIHSEGGFRR